MGIETLMVLKKVKDKTMSNVINFGGGLGGTDLKESKISLWDVRNILYEQIRQVAQEILEKEFRK